MSPIDLLILLLFVGICVYMLGHRRFGASKLPPGPRGLPIIGNMLQLGKMPHQTLTNWAKSYGPIMSIKLGSNQTIVISSSTLAKEALQKNDQIFVDRPMVDAMRALNHHEYSIAWLPASNKWRYLRKILTMEMFTSQRLNACQGLRQEKVQQLMQHVQKCCDNNWAVLVGQASFTSSLNFISNTLFSMDVASYDSQNEFHELARGIMELIGLPNISDYFPILRYIDPQGLRRKTELMMEKVIEILDRIVNQRLQLGDSSPYSDILDHLLKIQKENGSEFTRADLDHFLMDLFVAGAETTSTTLEWAMAELLRNPKKLERARNELQQVIGKDRVVQESDVPNLPYVQAIIKETLRLHPVGPLLVHKPRSDSVISGFLVPKTAQLFVNVWAIGHDPNIWPNPNMFEPERFLGSSIDYKGHDFELLPFGSGRRICPGIPLAHRMLHLTLASLLHSFDWKLEDGIKPEDIDMEETFGLTLQKAVPLKAVPVEI